MIPAIQKLFTKSSEPREEVILQLVDGDRFKLEHIQSYGEASAEGFWYDQSTDEWVALIAGSATIEFEAGVLNLIAGDAIMIHAHQKHRVAKTSLDAVWIALHIMR
jgi:cupin 2 domain-containing protein